MEINNNDGMAKVLAFYLPQFFPNEFNDRWYGKGFTEWTNVLKAKPLYHGHYQPHLPADLGYYDLRVPEVAERQAELAREAGVFGFAYWHYWWGGDMLLNEPAERMLRTGNPDYPFCFAWANENWYKKLWDKDSSKDTLIKEQIYPGEIDNRLHFNYCLPFFKDKRYLTFNGRPLFFIYLPMKFPQIDEFIKQWNVLIRESGVADSFYFVGEYYFVEEMERLKSIGFDCLFPQYNLRTRIGWSSKWGYLRSAIGHFMNEKFCVIRKVEHGEYYKTVWDDNYDSREDVAVSLIPNWDNTPRASRRGYVYIHATPENFGKAVNRVLEGLLKKKNKIIFLKSWNEWAEGNYMEPDMKYGKGFIDVLGKLVKTIKE